MNLSLSPVLRQLVLQLVIFFAAIIHSHASCLTNLYNFNGNAGAFLDAGLALSGNTLYGTTWSGGSGGVGIVFKINTDGKGLRNFYIFNGSNRADPYAGLILSGNTNTLYGTTWGGGSGGVGTVFKINTDGTSFTNF